MTGPDFDPEEFDDEMGVFAPPLPRADRRDLIRPAEWRAAEAGLASTLAGAALAVGRLDAMLAGMDDRARQGATRRLALIEVETMLWAQGTPLRREEIGRDLMEARADADLDAMQLARWALRRLEGQGSLDDLRNFLGLHRSDSPALGDALALRPAGHDFDSAAEGFAQGLHLSRGLHPLSCGPFARMVWRLSDLSPVDDLVEAATWAARHMARCCEALRFVPMGRHGRQVWTDTGDPATRLERHLTALSEGSAEARLHLVRVGEWAADALRRTAPIKGSNPARVIAALAAQPLMTTAMVEEATGASRDTAERLLARMYDMGLVRELTGTRRFRLWAAAA
ncbi:hypothetical protein [Paracoccus sp. (in: a-proteobacteria)]|uniref:hypothetical protein n=1 Tax=Paracoccus sp. TaxID=267 RepID=UPI003A843C10